jgi:glycosyltransferase involved in cell wall biosynthesis
MTTPTLSVIVPVKSLPPDLHDQELLWSSGSSRSTNQSIESLVIVDGEADASAGLVIAAAEGIGVTRVVTLGCSVGPGGARNVGLDRALGDFVCFLDADDLADRDDLLAACALASGTNADLVALGFEEVDGISGARRTSIPGCNATFSDLLVKRVGVWRFLFRRSFLVQWGIRFPQLRYGEDLLFLLTLMESEPKLATLDSVAYTHRLHREGLSGLDRSSAELKHVLARLLELSKSGYSSDVRTVALTWATRVAYTNFARLAQAAPSMLATTTWQLMHRPRVAKELLQTELAHRRMTAS